MAENIWGSVPSPRLTLSPSTPCRLLEGPLAGPLAALQRRSTTHSDLRDCFPLQLCRNRCFSIAALLACLNCFTIMQICRAMSPTT